MPMALVSLGLSTTFPSVMAAAVSVMPQYPGTAAAINGLVQYGTAALTTVVVGFLPHDTPLPLAGLLFVTTCGALAAALVGWLDRPAESRPAARPAASGYPSVFGFRRRNRSMLSAIHTPTPTTPATRKK